MDALAPAFSVCPHDCPSTCALEVERLDGRTIGRVRGAKHNPYTAGVICGKVARYAERVHHPDRLRTPLRRTGTKGERAFQPLSWDDALDEVAEALQRAADRHGAEAVWPYYYAGTMGRVQRDGINRLRHVMRYSGQDNTICTALVHAGWKAGIGAIRGGSPYEMAKSDLARFDPSGDRIEVRSFDILLMHFAEEMNAGMIVRGLRAVSDFDFEFQMTGMNARLNPEIETVFLMSSESHQFISSRFVKEIGALGGDITSFVSPAVAKRLAARYAED
jgi:pantetheine-phosphate adenylyltransferase